jgi:hypothetical protein
VKYQVKVLKENLPTVEKQSAGYLNRLNFLCEFDNFWILKQMNFYEFKRMAEKHEKLIKFGSFCLSKLNRNVLMSG